MGFALHFLILLHSFVAGKVTRSSVRLSNYVKVNDSAVGMTTLGTAWLESSLLNCARAWDAMCHCFTYNETTDLCTPDTYTSPEGLSCDINSGFQIHSLGNITVCLWISTNEADFGTAEQSCKDKGGALVTLQTPEKKNLFFSLVGSLEVNTWIGLDDRDQEDTYTWHSDGSVLTAAQRADLFAPGQPDNSQGAEDCVYFRASRNGLHDRRCTWLALYVCEIHIQHWGID